MKRIATRVFVGVCIALVMMVVHKLARAYPATASFQVTTAAGGSVTRTGYSSDVAACTSISSAEGNAYSGGGCQSWSFGYIQGGACRGTCVQPPYADNTAWTGGVWSGGGLGCGSGGGTFDGASSCTCPAGQVDNGTACTAAPACPAGQYLTAPIFGGTCQNICNASGTVYDEVNMGGQLNFTYPSGAKTACVEVTRTNYGGGNVSAVCGVTPSSSLIVCADFGGGVMCESDTGYYNGTTCSSGVPNTVPDSPQTCDVGDMWCRNPSGGACAAGFSGATFNGQSICAKTGQPINAVPQPQSPAAPPDPSDVTTPRTVTPAPRTGETGDPNQRTVVGVGPGGTSVNGSGPAGTGGTGSGTGDKVSCGLPDTPKCKIDETGTPDGKSAYASATSAIDGVEKAVTDTATKAGSADGKNATLGVSFGIPSGCTNPPAIVLPGTGTSFVPDFCQYQSRVHDLMSIVWLFFTSIGCVGMVRRTITGGG